MFSLGLGAVVPLHAATDKTKSNLFMFFTPAGNFFAANHNGQ